MDPGNAVRSAARTQETVRYSLRNIPTELWRDLRLVAAGENKTIQRVIEEALRSHVGSRVPTSRRERCK